jgi:mono/diheme cytochrome c family protein
MRLLLVSAFALFAAVALAGQHGAGAGAHQHPEAAKKKNPVAADAKSLAEGKELYTANCADCHGETGKGDGPMAAYTGEPLPSDLTDAEWKHGSTDGEIFLVIHDGVENTGMRNFDKELTEQQIWHLVNYVKSLGPKPSPAH